MQRVNLRYWMLGDVEDVDSIIAPRAWNWLTETEPGQWVQAQGLGCCYEFTPNHYELYHRIVLFTHMDDAQRTEWALKWAEYGESP